MKDLERGNLKRWFRAGTNRGTITVDVERYQAFLDDSGLTDEQKEVFIHALWSIINDLVDFGFGVHPLQDVCGKPENLALEWDKTSADRVECGHAEHEEDLKGAPSLD